MQVPTVFLKMTNNTRGKRSLTVSEKVHFNYRHSLTQLDSLHSIEQVACGIYKLTVANYNWQANFEHDLKFLKDTAANYAAIDFLLHIQLSKNVQLLLEIVEAKCRCIWPLMNKAFHRQIWSLSGVNNRCQDDHHVWTHAVNKLVNWNCAPLSSPKVHWYSSLSLFHNNTKKGFHPLLLLWS